MRTKHKSLCGDKCKDKAHFWVIDDKNLGVCSKCGAQEPFPIHVFGWQNYKVPIDKASQSGAD
jgi:hypothetical protein